MAYHCSNIHKHYFFMTINDYFTELGVRCGRYEHFGLFGKTHTRQRFEQYALILQHKRKTFAYIEGVKYDFITGCRLDQPHRFHGNGGYHNKETFIIWHACYNDAIRDATPHLKIKPKT